MCCSASGVFLLEKEKHFTVLGRFEDLWSQAFLVLDSGRILKVLVGGDPRPPAGAGWSQVDHQLLIHKRILIIVTKNVHNTAKNN